MKGLLWRHCGTVTDECWRRRFQCNSVWGTRKPTYSNWSLFDFGSLVAELPSNIDSNLWFSIFDMKEKAQIVREHGRWIVVVRGECDNDHCGCHAVFAGIKNDPFATSPPGRCAPGFHSQRHAHLVTLQCPGVWVRHGQTVRDVLHCLEEFQTGNKANCPNPDVTKPRPAASAPRQRSATWTSLPLFPYPLLASHDPKSQNLSHLKYKEFYKTFTHISCMIQLVLRVSGSICYEETLRKNIPFSVVRNRNSVPA